MSKSTSGSSGHARNECWLFLATMFGFLILVVALSVHNNEWVGDPYLDTVNDSNDMKATTESSGLRGNYNPEQASPFVENSVDDPSSSFSTIASWEEAVDQDTTTTTTTTTTTVTRAKDNHEPSKDRMDSNAVSTLDALAVANGDTRLWSEDRDVYEIQTENEPSVVARMEDEHGQGP